MGKIFKIFVLFLAMLIFPNFGLTKDVLANHTIDDTRITITQSPNPVYTDSGDVAFELKATGGLTFPSGYYEYRILIPGRNECTTSKVFQSDNPNTILVIATIQKNLSCANIFGVRTFQLDYTPKLGVTSGNTPIVIDYPFSVQQPGGGDAPQLEALNPYFGGSEMPEVQIHNVKAGTTYSFWWEGTGGFPVGFGPIATRFRASSDGASGKIIIPKTGVEFNKNEDKTLCMEIGDYPFVFPSIPCKYKATFHYTLIAPPPAPVQPTCSISPPNPTEDTQSVSVNANRLPKNENFRTDLIVGSTVIPLPLIQSSGDSGIVSLPLATSLSRGSYAAKVYNNTANSFVCEAPFTVGPPASPSSGGIIRRQASGVLNCGDSADPGVPTALGCIRTTPVSFVENFIRFIIGISGGLAFLMMLLGAFQMLTSAGNPETLAAGKDRLTSAVIGLLFVIFAVLLLQIIGFDILGIPGFGR